MRNSIDGEGWCCPLGDENLGDDMKKRPRRVAAEHGRAVEADTAVMRKSAVGGASPEAGPGSRIHARFAGLGREALEIPTRDDDARKVDLE